MRINLFQVSVFACLYLFGCVAVENSDSDSDGKDPKPVQKIEETDPVVFEPADLFGTWRFTLRGADYDVEFDIEGARVSSELPDSPGSFSLSETGAFYGKHVKSGGSGATIWTGTTTYSGQMADDKRSMEGTMAYRRTGTSGVSESEDSWTAVKIADGIPEEPPTPEELAAQAMAQVRCARHEECLPGDLKIMFGDVQSCISSAERRYIWEAAMPGTGWTIEQFEACMAAIQTLSCAERNSRATVVAACNPPGEKAVGEPCLSNPQCATGFCSTANLTCGTCAELPPEGTECVSHGQCAPGQQCVLGICLVPLGSLRSCTDWSGCDYGFSCVDGICRAEAIEEEAACDVSDGNPWCSEEGYFCNTDTNQCIPITTVLQGQPCGWLDDNIYTSCPNNIGCQSSKCGTPPVAGAECSEDHNGALPLCRWPDECLEGKCKSLPAYSQTCSD